MQRKIIAFLLSLLCVAAMADVPQITKFYPNSSEKVVEHSPTKKVYAYFNAGSKVVSAKAQLMQNEELLGTVVFTGGNTPTNYATLLPSEENVAMEKVGVGNYTITIYEVTYIEDGEEKTYSDASQPLGATTYHSNGTNGTIVSTTGIEDRKIVSYYPIDGEEGVITYTFSKSVDPSRLSAYLEYGMGDMPYLTRVPCSLSDDGLVLTIDLRGLSLNSNALAYGNVFYDMDGKPMAPPSTIALEVNNLDCLDGTRIEFVSRSLDSGGSVTLTGTIHESLYYEDISFATPVLQSVEFYSALTPSDVHPDIVEGCDMMALTVENLDVLAKTDITLTAGAVNATIAWADITIDGNVLRAALPEDIVAAGSDALAISLTNYEFNLEDGAKHEIRPLDLSRVMREVTSVAALKALADGETVALNVPGGVTVTLSNDNGYCFLEDKNDGLMVVTSDFSKLLQESVLLTGKLVGTYQGSGMFMVIPEKSDYTEVTVNTSIGKVLTDVSEVSSGKYDCRLLSFVATDQLPISVIGGTIMIDGTLPVVTDFVYGFTVPDTIKDVTGVLYTDVSLGQAYLIIRSADDVNQEVAFTDPNTIAAVKSMGANAEFSIDVKDFIVTYTNAQVGISFVEDATGGVQVATDKYTTFLSAGKRFSGHLEGKNYDGESIFLVYEDKCNIEVEDVDVTYGAEISSEEALLPENNYRLVTFTKDNALFEPTDDVVYIDNRIVVVDLLGTLPEDYIAPLDVKSVTGILYPFNVNVMDDTDEDGGEVTNIYVLPRSVDDIVADNAEAIKDVSATTTARGLLYNISGMRIQQGERGCPSTLRPGLYIRDGKKIRI